MFRAVYRQIARFLDWVNRSGSGPSASRAAKEAKDHRRDVESRYGGGGSDMSRGRRGLKGVAPIVRHGLAQR